MEKEDKILESINILNSSNKYKVLSRVPETLGIIAKTGKMYYEEAPTVVLYSA